MKLAEALILRADCQKRIAQLKSRLLKVRSANIAAACQLHSLTRVCESNAEQPECGG